MPMLYPHERHELRTCWLRRYYEKLNQFEVVTGFYPARGLTLYLIEKDVMNITNCTFGKAMHYMRQVRKYYEQDKPQYIRTSDFCDYMKIDEMFIQVFLASFETNDEPLPPIKRLPALTKEEIATERPRTVKVLSELLKNGYMENTQTLALRAKLYDEANPLGEPMYIRLKFVQMVIRAFEVAQIYGCHIRTAQEMLKEVREKQRELYPESKLRRHVSIKRFCAVHNEDEKDLRQRLAELHGEVENEEEYD